MSLLSPLKLAIEQKDNEKIIENLNKLLNNDKNIELENINIAKSIFIIKDNEIIKLFVKLIAELCKNEHNRKLFTDSFIIENLLQLLSSNEETIVLETIRALGNICYENGEASNLIDKRGLEAILKILNTDEQRKSNVITTKASGFLVNLLSKNDNLQKLALKNGILDVLDKLLNKYMKSDHTLIIFLFAILNAVIDYVDDQNVIFSESLCNIIIKVFKGSTQPELSLMCLEILHSQSEKDEIKTILSKNGVCELVIELIEKYKDQVTDEESRSVMKMACDLIVIILTGDDCMNILYNNGKGLVYHKMTNWLKSDDPDLLSTAILAIGNFAREDINCIQIVQNGISQKLIHLLKKYNSKDSDLKVQHALLSTLKNLAIPKENKEQILKEGLIDVIYPIIETEQYVVIFKLLGTFRMVVDGQEKTALGLLSRKEFMEKVSSWCDNTDHLGVRGEVPRLLSWLITNCHSFEPFKNVISVKSAVKRLVEMISSNHGVMQNEAFNAIKLLIIGTKNNADLSKHLYEQLIEADFGNSVYFVVNRYGEKMDKHTIENLLNLLEQTIISSYIVDHLKTANLDTCLAKLVNNLNLQGNQEKLNSIISQIKA